jgi:hypothetical protein
VKDSPGSGPIQACAMVSGVEAKVVLDTTVGCTIINSRDERFWPRRGIANLLSMRDPAAVRVFGGPFRKQGRF